MKSIRPSRLRAVVSAVPLVLLSATWGMLSHAANIVRGPYLVQGTTNGVVLRWRTDVATASFVRYGPSPANWTGQASNSTLVGEHVVQISGLQTDTRYYYQVGTGVDWFTGDTNRSFFTSPPQGIPKPTRIWALGDAGTGNAEQVAVRDGYTAYNGTNRTD